MKKMFSYMLLAFISVLAFSTSVFAEEKSSCSYNVQYADGGFFKIKAIANSDSLYGYDVLYQIDANTWKSTSNYKTGDVIFYSKDSKYISEATNMFSIAGLTSKEFALNMSSSKLTTECPIISVYYNNISTYSFHFADSSNDFYLYNIEGKKSGSDDSTSTIIKENTSCPYTVTTRRTEGFKDITVYSSFRMKSDGTKLVCASATSANVNSSCTEYTSGDYTTNIGVGGESYVLNITNKDFATIFSQTTAQKEKNEFTCPSPIYLVYTSATDKTLLLTTDKNVAEEYNKSMAGDVTTPTEEITTQPVDNSDDDGEHIGDDFCETKNVLSVLRMVGYVLTLLKVFIPIIIIVWGTLNLYNVIMSGTSDSLKKQIKNLIYRVIIGICIFFIPTLVHAILKNFIPEDAAKCETCVLKPFSCNPVDSSTNNTNTNTTTTTKSSSGGGGAHTSPSGAEHGGGGHRH